MKEVKAKTKLTDSIRNAVGTVNGTKMVVSCMDFAFIGGSLGSVMGEKIRRAIDYCIENKLPYMIICRPRCKNAGSYLFFDAAGKSTGKIGSAFRSGTFIHRLSL